MFTDLEQQIIKYGFFRQQRRMEEAEESFRKIQAELKTIARSESRPTTGAYRWIENAARLLRLLDPDSPAWCEEVDKLLSGVPCPQVDLGFNSPADKAIASSADGNTSAAPMWAIDELKADCNRFVNGRCDTLACLRTNGCAVAHVIFALGETNVPR